jgi:hypothetical protein
MRSLPITVALLLLAACPACSKKPDSSPGSAAVAEGSASPVSPPSPAAGAAASPKPSALAGIGATLADRLQREAQSRPPIHPNADDLLAAFGKVGGEVSAKRQGLGATYKASFCEGGTTSDGTVTVGVCEYADGPSAKAGLAAMQAIYPAKQASHLVHNDTILTTLRLQDGPAAQALESRLVSTYLAM